MFSKRCEYAIRAVLLLAQRSKDGRKIGLREIAQGIGCPEQFMAKILQDLGRKRLLVSSKGPGGGFYLDEASKRSSLADVVTAIDGDRIFSGCGLGLHQCSELQPCPIHHEFKRIRRDMQAMLQKASVETFNEQLENQLAFLKN